MRPRPAVRHPELLVSVAGAVIVFFGALLFTSMVDVGKTSILYAPAYPHPSNGIETALDQFDGQANAAIAMDPTLARPDTWRSRGPEAAYRFARPLFGWMAWAGSLGQPGFVAWTLMVLTGVGTGLLLYGMAKLASRFGRDPAHVLVILVTPYGLIAAFAVGMGDAFGTGLALMALCRWLDDRRASAVFLFALAALCRESLLLVPFAIALYELHRRAGLRWVLPLVVPAIVFAAWLLLVKVRSGYLPSDFQDSDNFGRPLRGLTTAARRDWTVFDWAWFMGALALVGFALRRRLHPVVPWIIAAYAAFMVLLGSSVWYSVFDWGRVYLPIGAISIVAVLPLQRVELAEDIGRDAVGQPGDRLQVLE